VTAAAAAAVMLEALTGTDQQKGRALATTPLSATIAALQWPCTLATLYVPYVGCRGNHGHVAWRSLAEAQVMWAGADKQRQWHAKAPVQP